MSDELKPCPFCGGEASHNDGGNSVYGRFWWRVGCTTCKVSFSDLVVWMDDCLDPSYPPKSCFALWNTRADDQIEAHPKVQALASALRMADAAIRGSNINMRVLERRIIEALAALEDKP